MKHKIIYFVTYCFIVVSAVGCKKWLDINTDPANPQQPKAEFLISPIIYQMANNMALDGRYLGKYLQNFGNPAAGDDYERHGWRASSDDAGSLWRMVYVNHGKNLEDMIANAQERSLYAYVGIGYAVKAWGYQTLTDYTGPIILDDFMAQGKLQFYYQDQPDVYNRVREWCHIALDNLNKTESDTSAIKLALAGPSGDQMYRGDKTKWKKFVYGILAQQFSHLVKKPEFTSAYADSVIKYADLSFSSTQDDATINFSGNTADDSNPYSVKASYFILTSSVNSQVSGRIGQPIVDLLSGGVRGNPRVDTMKNLTTGITTSDDPRLFRMIASNPDSVYRGVLATIGDQATTKRIPHVYGTVAAPYPGRFLFMEKARFPIMTYSQMQFIKAEAQFIKGDKAGAYTSYLNGIRAHMAFVNNYLTTGLAAQPTMPAITPAQINAYLAGPSVAQTSGDLLISDIMSQKYIAQWGWGHVEQWNDLRKYYYDTTVIRHYFIPENLYPDNNGKFVQRVRPRFNSEYVWNRTELEKWGGTRPDYHCDTLWSFEP